MNKKASLAWLLALPILAGFVVMGFSMIWGELGAYYSVETANETAAMYSRIEEAQDAYASLNATFTEQTNENLLIRYAKILVTGAWSVIKAIPAFMSFIIGENGLIYSILTGMGIPFPSWFVGGVLALMGIGVLFLVIRRGS